MKLIDYLNDARKTVTAVVGFAGTGVAVQFIGKSHAEQVVAVGGVLTSVLVYVIGNLPAWEADAKRVREVFVPSKPEPAPLVTGTAAPHPSPYPHAQQGETR